MAQQDGLLDYKAPELGDPCTHCRQRPSTCMWTGEGGTLAYVHGCYTYYCDICALEGQLLHAEACAARIPQLRQALAEAKAKG